MLEGRDYNPAVANVGNDWLAKMTELTGQQIIGRLEQEIGLAAMQLADLELAIATCEMEVNRVGRGIRKCLQETVVVFYRRKCDIKDRIFRLRMVCEEVARISLDPETVPASETGSLPEAKA